jgi:2-desacetyl-2-hydroxyethyl bacteriochlorophyllide A dehydrogenase
MKAAFYEGNERIRIGPCEPVDPGRGQVQIRVSHCGICGTDLHIFHGRMDHRVRFPAVLGHEMSGTIVAAGPGVDRFREGDRVTVMPLDACGECPACRAGHSHICHRLKFIGIDAPGAMQSLWTVPAYTLHHLPDTLSFEQGALIEPIAVACHDIRLAEVKPDEYVVVQGAGPIGALIALAAEAEGARVVMTEINPYRIALARDLGLDVIDAQQTDVAAMVSEETGGAGADVVFEVSGSAAGAELMTRLPRTRGRICVVAIFAEPPKIDLFRFFWRELRLLGARVYEHQDFDKAIQLAASGRLPLDRLITRVAPIDELEESFRQLERGGEVMKILMRCDA